MKNSNIPEKNFYRDYLLLSRELSNKESERLLSSISQLLGLKLDESKKRIFHDELQIVTLWAFVMQIKERDEIDEFYEEIYKDLSNRSEINNYWAIKHQSAGLLRERFMQYHQALSSKGDYYALSTAMLSNLVNDGIDNEEFSARLLSSKPIGEFMTLISSYWIEACSQAKKFIEEI
jgi:hypothetical protein